MRSDQEQMYARAAAGTVRRISQSTLRRRDGHVYCSIPVVSTTKNVNAAGAAMSPNLVLVVDDDAAILELIAQVLNEEGYPTITANGGRSAIAQARARLPRLIVLDMMMPEVN